jgi:hypothetical protein
VAPGPSTCLQGTIPLNSHRRQWSEDPVVLLWWVALRPFFTGSRAELIFKIPCFTNAETSALCQALAVPDPPADCNSQALVSPQHERPLKPIESSTPTPGLNAAPTAEPSTPKIPKRKTQKRQAPKLEDQLKAQGLTGIIIEQKNLKCIVGECSVICALVDDYKKHLKTVHEIRNSHTSGNLVDCPVSECSKKLREGSVMRHILTHSDAIRLGCTACPRSFTRIDSLRTHTAYKHPSQQTQT